MPEINENTATTEITIAGKAFTVPQPYTEGHVLSTNEAAALNQTYAENLRNNFAGKVKEAEEAGTFELEVFQGRLDDYASEYEFGVRTGGGRTSDPVQAEAMAIARDLVRRALQKKGHKLADVPAKKISELARHAIDKGDATSEKILGAARIRVDAAQELAADVDVDEEAPKGRKHAKETVEA